MPCLTILLLLICCAEQAAAQGVHKSGPYVGLRLGPSFVFSDDMKVDAAGRGYTLSGSDDDGAVLSLGILAGYDFYPVYTMPVRLELEYMGRSDFDYSHGDGASEVDADIGVSTFFLNSYYDFRNSTVWTPYVGIGLGSAFHDTAVNISGLYADYSGGDESSDLAWNLSAGVGLRASERIVVDFGWRYANFGTAEYKDGGNTVSTELRANEFLAGVRYEF
ncbi:MAG: outer membrane beta-barrel protein [Desulfocurvibacter africanus]